MGAQVNVFFAGEHEGKSREAEDAAWEQVATDKREQYARLVDSRWIFSIADVIESRLTLKGYRYEWSDGSSWAQRAYITDLMRMAEEAGTVSGIASRRTGLLVWFLGMARFRFDITVTNEDPHTAQREIERRLALMEEAYPDSVVRQFKVKVDIVQPVDAAMVKLESGIAAIEGVE